MALKTLQALAAAAALAFTGVASAGTAPFTMISGVGNPGIDVYLSVEASANNGFDFTVTNDSTDGGIVTGVFFESLWSTLLGGTVTDAGPAVFDAGTQSPAVTDWAGSMVSHTVGVDRVRSWVPRHYVDNYFDRLDDGLQPGESHTFSFSADGSVSLGDLEDAIGNPGFGVAIRMQDLTGDRYAAGWGLVETMQQPNPIQGGGDQQATGIPSPTAAFAGLALMAVTGLRRRRNG